MSSMERLGQWLARHPATLEIALAAFGAYVAVSAFQLGRKHELARMVMDAEANAGLGG